MARLAAACVVLAVLAAPAARARPVRRVFKPADLEFQGSGLAQLTLQFGVVRGQDAYRVSTPAFELDVGLAPNLELAVLGEIAVGGPLDGAFTFDRFAPNNTWTALKAGLLDVSTGADAWSAGLQVGPKLPTAQNNRGAGIEGLMLFGWRRGDTGAVLNLGGLLDPDPGTGATRPAGFEGGIDFDYPLGAQGRWALVAALSGVRYVSRDPDQLNFGLGAVWSPNDRLDISAIAFGGGLNGGDRWGLLLGIAPKARLW